MHFTNTRPRIVWLLLRIRKCSNAFWTVLHQERIRHSSTSLNWVHHFVWYTWLRLCRRSSRKHHELPHFSTHSTCFLQPIQQVHFRTTQLLSSRWKRRSWLVSRHRLAEVWKGNAAAFYRQRGHEARNIRTRPDYNKYVGLQGPPRVHKWDIQLHWGWRGVRLNRITCSPACRLGRIVNWRRREGEVLGG